jgi:serine/threonine-protein kinase
MGTVFEAENVRLEKRVALKALHEHLALENISVARFLREGRAASQVTHPHVVTVFELGEENGLPYLVMELLDGADLGEHLRRHGPLPMAELASLMLPVISALCAAHRAGVVHRDLKPSNIILAKDAFGAVMPKVVDFGISKIESDAGVDSLTQTQSVLGTVYYMSPEHTRSARNADARSDQYSLGVILYECATGVRPFSGDSTYEVMHAIMTAPVEAPSARAPARDIPPQLDALVVRALAKRPEDRFPSLEALGAALLELADAATRERWARELEPGRVSMSIAEPPQSPPPRSAGARVMTAADTAGVEVPRKRATSALSARVWVTAVLIGAVLAGATWLLTAAEPEQQVQSARANAGETARARSAADAKLEADETARAKAGANAKLEAGEDVHARAGANAALNADETALGRAAANAADEASRARAAANAADQASRARSAANAADEASRARAGANAADEAARARAAANAALAAHEAARARSAAQPGEPRVAEGSGARARSKSGARAASHPASSEPVIGDNGAPILE